MKRFLILFLIITACAAAAASQGLSIGATVDNFVLTDTNGKTLTLNDLKGTHGIVVVFVSSQCPVVRAYNERMNQTASDYKAKGINVIGVNANVTELPTGVKMHSEATYKFRVLIDKNSSLADKLGANNTPEAFFFGAKNVLLYHGAIDNNRAGTDGTEPYLRNAFDAVLAGKKVEKATTAAFGCGIKRPGADL